MRIRHSFWIAVVSAVALAVTAFAAEGGRGGAPGGMGGRGAGLGGMGMINKMLLVGVDKVKQELKITDDQAKKLTEITTAFREEQRKMFGSMQMPGRDATPEERTKAREERQKKTAELVKSTEAKVDAALQKEQVTRLNEILTQQQGVEGLTTERVVAALKLSEEQVKKIKDVIATRDKEMQALMPGRGAGGEGAQPGGTREERQKKMEDIRKKAETGAVAILTKDQQEGYTKLKGKPFELDRASLFQGFGGPGGGRQGGGRRGGGEGGAGGGTQ